MRQSVRRLLLAAGAVAAAGAMACGQGLASASTEARGQAGGVSAAAATYVPPGKALYVGEHGRAVRSVQRRLNALHYYAGPVDGTFGLDLQEAAWAFREVQGLTMNASLAAEPINRAFERDTGPPEAALCSDQARPGVPRRDQPADRGAGPVQGRQGQPDLARLVRRRLLLLRPDDGGGCGNITPDGDFHTLSFNPGWVRRCRSGRCTTRCGSTPPRATLSTAISPCRGIRRPTAACGSLWTSRPGSITRSGSAEKHPTPVYIRGTAPYQPEMF